MSVINQR